MSPQLKPSISCSMGSGFILKMARNPSTGYSWVFKNSTDISQLVQEVSSSFVSDPNPKGYVGVGGYDNVLFSCKGSGYANLTYSYQRGSTAVAYQTYASVGVINKKVSTYDIKELTNLNVNKRPGDIILLRLTNSTSGYSWNLNGAEDINKRGIILNLQFKPRNNRTNTTTNNKVGASNMNNSTNSNSFKGSDSLTFIASKEGTEVLEFQHVSDKNTMSSPVTGRISITVSNTAPKNSTTNTNDNDECSRRKGLMKASRLK